MAFGSRALCFSCRVCRIDSLNKGRKSLYARNQSNRKRRSPAHIPLCLLPGLQNVYEDDPTSRPYAHQCPHRYPGSDFGRDDLLSYVEVQDLRGTGDSLPEFGCRWISLQNPCGDGDCGHHWTGWVSRWVFKPRYVGCGRRDTVCPSDGVPVV